MSWCKVYRASARNKANLMMMDLPINVDIYQAAVELSPARRATLNLRRRMVAAQRLQRHSGLSWGTSENLTCVPDTAMTCIGGFLLLLFIQCLLHNWRRHKGAHPTASRYTSRGAAVYGKVAKRLHKVWKRQKHGLEKGILCFKLWCIVLYYLAYGKTFRVWTKCKKKLTQPVMRCFDRGKLVYMKVTISIHHQLQFLRVSAVVIFLWLFMSGDVELNPGPKDGEYMYI